MEKRSPTYDLDTIKVYFSKVERLAITRTALQSAQALGFRTNEIVAIIQTITRTHFYKSMTSHADHRIWQDVYHVPHNEVGELYIKFTSGEITDFMVLSFKRKEEEQ